MLIFAKLTGRANDRPRRQPRKITVFIIILVVSSENIKRYKSN
jgi:hypothetical protein